MTSKTTTTRSAEAELAQEVEHHRTTKAAELAAAYGAAGQTLQAAEEALGDARDASELASSDYSGSLAERSERAVSAAQQLTLAKSDVNRLTVAHAAAVRHLDKHNTSTELAEAVAPLLGAALPGSLTISQILPMIPKATPEPGNLPVFWLVQTERTITDPEWNQHDKLTFSGERSQGVLAGKCALIVFQPDYLAGVDLVPDSAITKALGSRLRVLRDGGQAGSLKRKTETFGGWIRTVIELDIRAVFPQVPVILNLAEVTDKSFHGYRGKLGELTDAKFFAVALDGSKVSTEGDRRHVEVDLTLAAQAIANPAEVSADMSRLARWADGRVTIGLGRVTIATLGEAKRDDRGMVSRSLRLVLESTTSIPA